ncbi:MAG: GNAT family N-acetyltransferase [Polyangiaceae bacterium]|nr:GNAT family N-acetyltransferase [Polyangiaceae bacterium]
MGAVGVCVVEADAVIDVEVPGLGFGTATVDSRSPRRPHMQIEVGDFGPRQAHPGVSRLPAALAHPVAHDTLAVSLVVPESGRNQERRGRAANGNGPVGYGEGLAHLVFRRPAFGAADESGAVLPPPARDRTRQDSRQRPSTSSGDRLPPRPVTSSMHERYRLVWSTSDRLVAYEPTSAEVAHHAPALSAAYSEPHNAAMMSNSGAMSPDDVIEHFLTAGREGARLLLLERDGALAGDADLRHIAGGRAEAAILIGARAAQGQGLGTRFGVMLHAFAFRALRLERVHVAIIPANIPSQRLFRRLGHVPDDGPEGRAFAEASNDITYSVGRAAFEARFAAELAAIRIDTVS